MKGVAIQKLEEAIIVELKKKSKKSQNQFWSENQGIIRKRNGKGLAKEGGVIKGDLIGEMKVTAEAAENDLSEINLAKILENNFW